MATGVALFGKTQFRRDFLSIGMPRPLLTLWEGWLARGMARSRELVGEGWTERFLTMPIWHGALGRSLCGVAAVVAVMPSMDGAGRCFPASVLAWSDAPDAATSAAGWPGWAEAAGAFLLGTLDEAGSHEGVLAALERLPGFPQAAPGEAPTAGPDGSAWWTDGGERLPQHRFTAAGLPGPEAWADMIGGAEVPPGRNGERPHVG